MGTLTLRPRMTNKKFELMLTGRAKAYSSSCPQAVTHRSTNRARRRVTSFQPKRVTNYATPPTPVPWRHLVNDIDLCCSAWSAKKSFKPPILAFKVIQGHWIRRQSKASIRFVLAINSNLNLISHRYWDTATYWPKIANFTHHPLI